jgi:hypothetical protein
MILFWSKASMMLASFAILSPTNIIKRIVLPFFLAKYSFFFVA